MEDWYTVQDWLITHQKYENERQTDISGVFYFLNLISKRKSILRAISDSGDRISTVY